MLDTYIATVQNVREEIQKQLGLNKIKYNTPISTKHPEFQLPGGYRVKPPPE